MQIKLGQLKDPSLSDRISWVHGNLYVLAIDLEMGTEDIGDSLTTRLPFDDDEFDHVHVKDIARGVPESKVLAPGTITVTLDTYSRMTVGFRVCGRYWAIEFCRQ